MLPVFLYALTFLKFLPAQPAQKTKADVVIWSIYIKVTWRNIAFDYIMGRTSCSVPP